MSTLVGPRMSTPRTVRLSPNDNVVVAVDPIPEGAAAAGVTARARVMRGHKMAVAPIAQGQPVRKYDQIIGFATQPIAPGEWVHTQNVEMHDFARDYRFAEGARNDEILPPELRATFEGYVRPGGKTGTRNYIGILTSVNCSASAARFIAREVERSGVLSEHPEIDGVVAFVHGTGCGLAAYGEGFDVLRRTQWGYATHANLGGALMVGLGCEVFQIDRMKEEYGLVEGDHFQTMTIQATGGTKKTVAEGVERIKAMLPIAARAKRETRPASEVTLALQCGGSDGYSAITANPALGAASDLLVRHGGTSILSETPEIYGAEHLLTRRAATREIGEKLVARIKWWEDYTAKNGGEMNNNPSPGNKAGGLTTILEKSLGAAAKGGQATLRAVYE
ncbi:MAG: altronate hydrolase, partial [Hyphomicrobiales bacterium]|nr:altronate hydrolase [Hyphomicrobiales bacterium]